MTEIDQRKAIQSVHHISAIVGEPQEVIDFYQDILRLQLIKQTLNFDDTATYHFYFSSKIFNPNFVMTFFPWTSEKAGRKGQVGSGQFGRTVFKIPSGSLAQWQKRLDSFSILYEKTTLFDGVPALLFSDFHDLPLALVEGKELRPTLDIIGFYGIELLSAHPEESRDWLIDILGIPEILHTDEGYLFEMLGAEKHRIWIPNTSHQFGHYGVGTVHHLAWAVEDLEELRAWYRLAKEQPRNLSDILNRKYFTSIYYREPGHAITEMATNGPGFTVDEDFESLGQKLQFPKHAEKDREKLLATLPQIKVKDTYGKMMSIDPKDLAERENYKLMIGSIVPRPIALVTTLNEDDSTNIAPFSYFNLVTSNPPIVSLAIQRTSEGKMKDTTRNLLREKEAVIHVVDEDNVAMANESAVPFKYGESELDRTGFSLIASKTLKTPSLKETKFRFEVELYDHIEVRPDDQVSADLILLKIKSYVLAEKLMQKGRIDPDGLAAMSRLAGHDYAKIGNRQTIKRPEQ